MPFKSYAEMRAMFSKDPEQAKEFVQHAKEMGKPVVSSKNPGYDVAAKRRMAKMMTLSDSQKEESTQKTMSKRNKRIGY